MRTGKSVFCDTYDRERNVVEPHRLADNVRIGVEADFPERVADEGHAIGCANVIVRDERPPERGAGTEYAEVAAADGHQRDGLGQRTISGPAKLSGDSKWAVGSELH